MHELIRRKTALRKEMLLQAAALSPAYTTAADEAIIRQLHSLPVYTAARTIFCFVGMRLEINTLPLIVQALKEGKQVCVPLCTDTLTMGARQIFSEDDLVPGTFGILEPSASSPYTDPSQIDLAIIPCVTCSHKGSRLGHGGGYYDVYFSKNKIPHTVMICREKLIREDIPVAAHDIRFPVVITEAGIFR